MKRQTTADAAMTAVILLLGASLFFTGSVLLRHRSIGSNRPAPLELTDVVGAGAAGAGIAVTLWWLCALVLAFVSALAPVWGGARLAVRAEAWSPAHMRRLVAVILGLNLLGVPLAVGSPGSRGPIDPHWQSGAVAAAPLNAAGGDAGTSGVTSDRGSPPVDPVWTPQAPAVDPGPLARPESRPPMQQEHSAGGHLDVGVVVRGGDSLWGIVAAALGPYATDVEVAQAWPEWYQANRSMIGSDPNVILPGQVLHSPAAQP